MIGTPSEDGRPRDARGHFKKRAIPAASRRAVALKAGGQPLRTVAAACHYCGAPGRIHWITASWVTFEDLELDHVVPEYHGGDGSPANLVLACVPCNRRKGARYA